VNLPDSDLIQKAEMKSATKTVDERNAVSAVLRQYCASVHNLKLCTDLLSGYVTGQIGWQQFREAKHDALPP
jgi:hypothetical protein